PPLGGTAGRTRECPAPRRGRSIAAAVLRPRRVDPLAPADPEHDLIVTWEGCADTLVHPRAGTIGPVPFHRTGAHSHHGFAFVSGPGIEPKDGGDRSVLDLAPTIVALLGQPVPPDTPGKPLLEGLPVRS